MSLREDLAIRIALSSFFIKCNFFSDDEKKLEKVFIKMLTLTSRKTLIIWIAILAIIVITILLPIKISYNLFVRGKILPANEWIIYKGSDGRLTSQLINYKTGINQSYDVTLFDRGDAMQFEFN